MPAALPAGPALPHPPSSSSAAGDGRVAELLSRLFALIQADMLVPSTVRAVLARLQVARDAWHCRIRACSGQPTTPCG